MFLEELFTKRKTLIHGLTPHQLRETQGLFEKIASKLTQAAKGEENLAKVRAFLLIYAVFRNRLWLSAEKLQEAIHGFARADLGVGSSETDDLVDYLCDRISSFFPNRQPLKFTDDRFADYLLTLSLAHWNQKEFIQDLGLGPTLVHRVNETVKSYDDQSMIRQYVPDFDALIWNSFDRLKNDLSANMGAISARLLGYYLEEIKLNRAELQIPASLGELLELLCAVGQQSRSFKKTSTNAPLLAYLIGVGLIYDHNAGPKASSLSLTEEGLYVSRDFFAVEALKKCKSSGYPLQELFFSVNEQYQSSLLRHMPDEDLASLKSQDINHFRPLPRTLWFHRTGHEMTCEKSA